MSTVNLDQDTTMARILDVVRRYWGYTSLRPLQEEAIRASLARRDSLVVMPTGGGKSLCYQVPPLVADRLDVVVSPLISLMKDQVDGLREAGYPAAALHSGLSPQERNEVEDGLREGKFRLVFVAPERILTPWFLQHLQRLNVQSFSVDEAHCISQWGHDFRPEYRQLAVLRQHFPDACFHAFTATATPRVRQDIIAQLHLRDPAVLVGIFDRPNLIYRIIPQVDLSRQTVEAIRRHRDEAVIVYCISRKDTEQMAATLKANNIHAAHYHAGMNPEQRRKTQEAFADEKLDVVVATVAFGMGIDRSNVRCVLHTAMPKTVEHYQQETGRAGRDGLEAECVLLYSTADVMRWERLIQFSAEKAQQPAEVIAAQTYLLHQVQKLCGSTLCRHKELSEYFGQTYDKPNCGACDYCLGEVEGIDDATILAKKILSCIARTGQRFGVGHVVDVLAGASTEQIRRCRHEELSTYGLLKEIPRKSLMSMVYQLIDQDVIGRTPGDRPTLHLNPQSLAVMRGQQQVRLVRPKKEAAATTATRVDKEAWAGVDRGLFEHLRGVRREIAAKRDVPPFLIFTDNTLRDLARVRPTTLGRMQQVRGIGEKRLVDFGPRLLEAIVAYCHGHKLPSDQGPADAEPNDIVRPKKPNLVRDSAFEMFDRGMAIDEVAAAVGRAFSTTTEYLVEFIQIRRPKDISAWVPAKTYQRITEAATVINQSSLKPIYEHLEGAVKYEEIKLVLTHSRVMQGEVEKA